LATEAGEFIVGAYLTHIHNCGIILYNTRPPGGKLAGLNELDVIGLNLPEKKAFLCEVTTHLHGMRPATLDKMPAKHRQQKLYALSHLNGFATRYMVWSPLVTPRQAEALRQVGFDEVIVNADYTRAVDELRKVARSTKADLGNPFMRTIQILAHLRKIDTGSARVRAARTAGEAP
jgi:hypothetical protein